MDRGSISSKPCSAKWRGPSCGTSACNPGLNSANESSRGSRRLKPLPSFRSESCLNIVETLFGKMARTFLRHIRVQSWAELRQRIIQGIAEINAAPVVHRWRKFDALAQVNQGSI